MAKKVPASLKDREKSYYKYYAQDIAAAPQEKYDMITPEPGNNADALRIQDRNDLFLPGDLPGEFGCLTGGSHGIRLTVFAMRAGIMRIIMMYIWMIPRRHWI